MLQRHCVVKMSWHVLPEVLQFSSCVNTDTGYHGPSWKEVAKLSGVTHINETVFFPKVCVCFVSEIIAHNVKSLMSGKKLKVYTPSPAFMMVTLGRTGGVGQLPNGMVVGNFLTKKLKSSKLFTDKFWKMAHRRAPSSWWLSLTTSQWNGNHLIGSVFSLTASVLVVNSSVQPPVISV